MIEVWAGQGAAPPLRRVVVLGISGSGKTTVAGRLAALRGVPHIELDALFWEPGWRQASVELFRSRIAAQLALHRAWVVDGNYSRSRDLIWPLADTLVWLDYSLPRTIWQLWWRSWRRIVTRVELWNGNRESFRSQFIDSESLLRDVWLHHRARRVRFRQLLVEPAYGHTWRVRLSSRAATERWLRSLPRGDGMAAGAGAGRG